MFGPSFCTCGPHMVCGGVVNGCNACEASVRAGVSCGTRCSATPNRFRSNECSFCGGSTVGSVNPTGYYCDSCVNAAQMALAAPLN